MLWAHVGEVVDLDVDQNGRRGLVYGPNRSIVDAEGA